MYRIKRFSILEQRQYVKLSTAKDHIADHEIILLCHFICYMGNSEDSRFNDHWPEEITVFIEDDTKAFNTHLTKLKHIDMFPLAINGTDAQLVNKITNKLTKEKRYKLIKIAAYSDLLKRLLIEFTDELDKLVKRLRRTISSSDSDIELVKSILHGIRSSHYDELEEWRNSY